MRSARPAHYSILLLLFFFGFAFIGCSAKVITRSGFNGIPSMLALLPQEYPPHIQREKIDFIQRSLLSELENRNFTVVDEKLVASICSSSACPEREELSKQFGVSVFASVTIDAIARNNFIAGYYNVIRGKLSFSDVQGAELLRVEHGESERGGVLFQSGQIIQGIISQIENSEEGSFPNLAGKFVQSLVTKLPEPQEKRSPSQPLAISAVDFAMVSPAVHKICAVSEPQLSAFLVFGNDKTNLRETSPGNYCGIYRISDIAQSSASTTDLALEVRSPFGNVVRETIFYSDGKLSSTSKGL